MAEHTPSTPALYTLAFYNLENLFDTIDDKQILDDDFTPDGFKKWSSNRYSKKLHKLGKTISRVGTTATQKAPVLLGVAEVENRKVLKDLLKTRHLENVGYQFVHYNSPDERGIDTALIYCTNHFELMDSRPIPLDIKNGDGSTDHTRDILHVKGMLNGELMHIFVNHWPSRRAGVEETESKRIQAASRLLKEMNLIRVDDPRANFIVMGDFNDGPGSASIRKIVDEGGLYNPMLQLLSPERGSANYKHVWSLFDQILLSHSLLNFEPSTHTYTRADIYDRQFLAEWKGRFRGNPFKTYAGPRYLGGTSDHFPVFVQLRYNQA